MYVLQTNKTIYLELQIHFIFYYYFFFQESFITSLFKELIHKFYHIFLLFNLVKSCPIQPTKRIIFALFPHVNVLVIGFHHHEEINFPLNIKPKWVINLRPHWGQWVFKSSHIRVRRLDLLDCSFLGASFWQIWRSVANSRTLINVPTRAYI